MVSWALIRCMGRHWPISMRLIRQERSPELPRTARKGTGDFNFDRPDRELREIERLGMEPVALFPGAGYGIPKWRWPDGGPGWGNPPDKSVESVVEEIATFLDHVNGKKGSPGYKLRVKYVELYNEPGIKGDTIDGYAKAFKAVANRLHKDYPGVKIGGGGFYETPYMKMFIDKCGKDIDWISRHPYGWTREMIFKQEDDFMAYAKSKGYNQIKYIITEWDFWIQGRTKFDYMMKRGFESAKREELIGALHYVSASILNRSTFSA